jgi:cytoskeletal protein RodZ
MPTVAEQLRHGREAAKLDVHQVAEATKLKTDQVRALEQGNYDYFSAPVYVRGSLRTYARLLKLDSVKLVEQLDEELISSEKFAADPLAPTRRKGGVDTLMLLLSRVNWSIAAVVIALALIALLVTTSYRAWKNHQSADPLKQLGAGMYQPPAQSGEILPFPTNGPTNARSPAPNGK